MKSTKFRIPLYLFVVTLYWLSLYAYIPYLAPYAESMGASYRLVGLILGSYGLIQLVIRIPLGILSDSIRRRKIFIIVSLLLALISSLGFMYFPNPYLMLFFRAIAGAAAAGWVIFTVLFSSYFGDKDAPKAIGYISSCSFTGQVVALLLGAVAAQYFSWKLTFGIAIIASFLGFILSFAIIESKPEIRVKMKISKFSVIWENKHLVAVSLLAILIQIITYATMYGFTPLLAKNIGANNFELGILTALAIIPGVFISSLTGFFTERFGERPTIVCGFLMMTIYSITIPFLGHIYFLYLAQFMGGIGRNLIFPLLMGLSIKGVATEIQGTAMGVFQALYSLGMFAGPIILGFVSEYSGLNFGFIFIGFISLLGAILTLKIINTSSLPKVNLFGRYN